MGEVETTDFDLLIVGAGPAGMAAAVEAVTHGLTVALFDEGSNAGGQIYRNVSISPISDKKILGEDYFYGARLVADASSCGARVVTGATVWMVERHAETSLFSVGVLQAGSAKLYSARGVLIATGALERPFPINGWTLPGVMTAGAAQSMLKASGAVPEGKVVLAGTGPLIYLLAAQFARGQVPVAALLDTTPYANLWKAFAHLPGFLVSAYFRKGVGLLREVGRSTRIIRGVTSLKATGSERLEAITFEVGARRRTIAADTMLLHQGVVPQVNLAMAAGCRHSWSAERLAFEPDLDQGCRSSVPGLFIAGDTGGIGGALAAEISGTIAALHFARDMGKVATSVCDLKARSLKDDMKKVLRGRSFIDAFYKPAEVFRMPADDVVVCRCEEVHAGEVRAAAVRGAQGPNQTKTFLRTGMGPCQGRLCGLTVTELMARTLDKTPNEIGYFHIRNPVKPITLGALAGLKGDGETRRLF